MVYSPLSAGISFAVLSFREDDPAADIESGEVIVQPVARFSIALHEME